MSALSHITIPAALLTFPATLVDHVAEAFPAILPYTDTRPDERHENIVEQALESRNTDFGAREKRREGIRAGKHKRSALSEVMSVAVGVVTI